MVRATRRILSWARAERPSSVIAAFQEVAALVVQLAELARQAVAHVGVVAGLACRGTAPAGACRAAATCSRISPLGCPASRPKARGTATAGTSMWMSIRSNSGPLILRHVPLDLRHRAVAAAAAGRRGSRTGKGSSAAIEHEVGRERRARQGPGDRHRAVFQRLAQHFQRAAVELGQFVEEQHAVVGQADLARARASSRRPPGPRR